MARRPASGHNHGVTSAHPTSGDSRAQQRALLWALAINAGLLAAELAGGLLFGSLALLADATHLLTDVIGLVVALIAARLIVRPATKRHSFGWQRADALAAQANSALLLAATGWIAIESIRRLGHLHDFRGGPTLVIALVGLAGNAASAAIVARQAGHSLNVRGAVLHLAGDAATSLGVVIAAVAELVWDVRWVDPAVSLAIAVVVVWTAWRLLRDATHVLLEGTPTHLELDEVQAVLTADAAVASVHHLHLWSLASDNAALSAHVVLGGELTLHQAQDEAERLKALLNDQFGITHATLEVECHACDTVPVAPPTTRSR